mmetsp:Transcript_13693/g.29253  ORF Transcript_13693/g.29253 Transcript_13693/m.29253 type:complete len:515 (-) Transcript_13693:115-1659(-)|eukprot:CAMPEP_0118926942 /NCGR_PEP_ID=MMETSP1169-20130426/4538_1 /TAXON_ID=36882 /ORGANISM="Pyramimonas obovata, Strain CCMP722" /LENGTH=514 /DNA_ID=CAMNT_0006868607 /DNA_START=330 /DNA_END=1874 /DNA_ORIENTATION=-
MNDDDLAHHHHMDMRSLSVEWKLWSSAEAELRVNPPNVRVDNETFSDATLVTVDSANRSGVLLEVVQTLTEMNMVIPKAIISSDGGWFVDVFHVTTADGRKIQDPNALRRIEKMLASECPASISSLPNSKALPVIPQSQSANYAIVELSVLDRPGLLGDVTSLLASNNLSVISAATWTQHTRAALVLFVEGLHRSPLKTSVNHAMEHQQTLDKHHLRAVRQLIQKHLGCPSSNHVNTSLVLDPTNVDLDKRLYRVLTTPIVARKGLAASVSVDSISSLTTSTSIEEPASCPDSRAESPACLPFLTASPKQSDLYTVEIDNTIHRGYSLVCIRCPDRCALLFDTVCVLFVSNYDVNHATIDVLDMTATMEFYVKTKAGSAIVCPEDREQLKHNLLTAIQPRPSGFHLQLSSNDRPGLLADVTRKLAESGLTITKAEVGRQGNHAFEKFLVQPQKDNGHQIDAMSMRKVCMEIGQTLLKNGHVQVDQHHGDKKFFKDPKQNNSDTVLETWISSGWA